MEKTMFNRFTVTVTHDSLGDFAVKVFERSRVIHEDYADNLDEGFELARVWLSDYLEKRSG